MKKNLSQKLKLLLTLFVLMAAVISASAGKSTTLAVIGDSYSTFNTDTSNLEDTDYYYPYWSKQNGNDVSDISETWREILADKINGEVVYVDAISNSELTSRGPCDKKSMTNRIMTSNDNLADVVILMGGLNDIWQKRDVGNIEPTAASYGNCSDYAPALRYSLRLLKEKNPKSNVIYCLVSFDDDEEYDYTKYLNAAKTICEDEKVTFIPLYGMECVSWHPTAKGMEQIADAICAAMATNGLF